MTGANGTSTSDLKLQAKRLREFLSHKGVELSHSQSLEAIAASYGFSDWNVASAKGKQSLKTYMLCCSFDMHDDGTRKESDPELGYFQYIVRRPSPNGLLDAFKEEITALIAKDAVTHDIKIDQLFIDNIIEIDVADLHGATLNLILPENNGCIGVVTPFVDRIKGVNCFKYFPDSLSEEEIERGTVVPFLTFDKREI